MQSYTYILDYDDVLGNCNGYAIEKVNRDFGLNISISDITSWRISGNETDLRIRYFNTPEFIASQPLLPGSKDFVRELASNENRKIMIATDVSKDCEDVRIERILNDFPEIQRENIHVTARKDLLEGTAILDDKPEHVLGSRVEFPVLFRRNWNMWLTDIGAVGIHAISQYDEFLELVKCIENRTMKRQISISQPSIIGLVGPSGSGKTVIADELIKSEDFVVPKSCTTREHREEEPHDAYIYLGKEEFLSRQNEGKFAETTMYAGKLYGTLREEIDRVLLCGRHVIKPIDMTGAISLKAMYKDQAFAFFVNRSRRLVLENIINRKSSGSDRSKRLASLDHEYSNSQLCDGIIQNNGTVQDAARYLHAYIEKG